MINASLTIAAPDGSTVHRAACRIENDLLVCEPPRAWYRGPGSYTATLDYVALDGVRERVVDEVTLHGDEIAVEGGGYVDDDGSIPEFELSSVRRPPAGVELRAVGDAVDGEPPPVVMVNGSDSDLVVRQQGAVLGHIARIGPEGAWLPVPRAIGGGCGTGLGPATLHPGERYAVGEIAPMGGTVPLSSGRYVFIVLFEDRETQPEVAQSIRAVTLEFEVSVDAGVAAPAESDLYAEFPDVDVDVEETPPVLPRPEGTAPRGLSGAALDADAPRVEDGSVIAGRIGSSSPRQAYRFVVPDNTTVVVRLYARCLESPCRAQFSAMFGRPGDLGGSAGPLHRERPAWSIQDRTFNTYSAGEHIFEISCREYCDRGGAEYYGRVHVIRSVEERF